MTDDHDPRHDLGSTLPSIPVAAPLRPDTLIGERYRLSRLIATDRDGRQFWRGRDSVLNRDMAVTVFPFADGASELIHATVAAGQLSHPGLPQTIDVGSLDRGSYITSQWPDGATLADLLGDGPLDVPVATALVARIAAAVAELHGHGLTASTLHPALIRINVDGQARFSHLLARRLRTVPRQDADTAAPGPGPSGDAAPGPSGEQGPGPAGDTTGGDIGDPDPRTDAVRRLGSLLYFTLTATWPESVTPVSLVSPHLPVATETEGRPEPVNRVNTAVPRSAARLIDRCWDVQDGHSRIDAADLQQQLERLAQRQTPRHRTAAPPSPRGERRDEPPSAGGMLLDPREQRLRRERRVKLGIAGSMLAVLSALVIIVVASVSKQFLDSIAAPILAADQQPVIMVTSTPTTTRTVAATSDGGAGSTGDGHTPPITSVTLAEPVAIVDATVFDPQGTPPKDNESYIDQAFDGDSSTAWMTWVYKQQFGRADGGLKDGVGLILEFAEPVSPTNVTVATGTPGTDVEVRSVDGPQPALDSTIVMGSATLNTDPVSIGLTDAPTSKYLLIWLTHLAPLGTEGGSGRGFQSNLTEITVVGRT